jgi:ACT domain-containing protein
MKYRDIVFSLELMKKKRVIRLVFVLKKNHLFVVASAHDMKSPFIRD